MGSRLYCTLGREEGDLGRVNTRQWGQGLNGESGDCVKQVDWDQLRVGTVRFIPHA